MRLTEQQIEEMTKQKAYEAGFNEGVYFGMTNTLEEIKKQLKSKASSYKGK